jgi:hypothetical protein
MFLVFAMTMSLLALGCTSTPSGETNGAAKIAETTDALTLNQITHAYCNAHPARCQRWCDDHPALCARLCHHRPHFAFCQADDAGPSCGTDDAVCTTNADCCAGFECFDNFGNGFICNEIPVDGGGQGPCQPFGEACDPNGLPCCNAGPGQPSICENPDPSDPDGFFRCDPL